jgi:hypothetical protein
VEPSVFSMRLEKILKPQTRPRAKEKEKKRKGEENEACENLK